MTFCGYHPAMSEGLVMFGEGVARSTVEKAHKAGRSIDEHIEVELSQLKELIGELSHAESRTDGEMRARARVLKNLASLCETTYLATRGATGDVDFESRFVQQFAQYGDLVRRLEDAYESSSAESIADKTKAGVYAAVSQSDA